jgi:myosin heavy subunit
LYNLKARHVRNLPYTRTGDIIIACNPYQWIAEIYTEEQQILYARKLVWDTQVGDVDPRKDVRPHVYETSALCYKGLAVDGVDQSVLVSGESGAGKTETVKICK